MTEIQQNRYDRLIRRVANIVGGGSQVNDTLNELFPTLDVENVPSELLALALTDLGFCSTDLPAVATFFNHHQLFNPVGSNMFLVVTQVAIESGTGQFFRFSNFIGAQTTLAGNERRRDTRAGTLAALVAQNRTGQSLSSGGLDFRIRVLALETVFVKDSNDIAILFPGTGLTITTGTANTQSLVSFMWRERVFEPAELVD